MPTYSSPGHKRLSADSFQEAAHEFARRKARQRFGRSGRLAALNLGAYSQDGRLAEVGAFIGLPAVHDPRSTVGLNINFTVYLNR